MYVNCVNKHKTIHFQLIEVRAPATDSEQYEVLSSTHKQEVMEMETNAAYASWMK